MSDKKTPPLRKWLTKKDAMRYLSASQRAIENLANQGRIRSYRLGGRVFFDQYELDEDIVGKRKK